MIDKLTPAHLALNAYVYVRQSTQQQVRMHHESRQRQYALADRARQLGFAGVVVIDEDLGRSGSGLVERPASANSWPRSARTKRARCWPSKRRDWRAIIATGITCSICVP